MSLKNNPHYQHGIFMGTAMSKHIEKTAYVTIENAIESKQQLVEDLKKQFEWDESHKDVAENLGIIAALEQMQSTKEANQPEHDLSNEDVINVAESIGIDITEDQSKEVLNRYLNAQDNDPSATWNLVIENLIHEINNENL